MPNSGKIGRLSVSVNSFVCSKSGTNEMVIDYRQLPISWVSCKGWARQQLIELSTIFFPASCVACGQDIFKDQAKENRQAGNDIPLCETCRFEVTDLSPRCGCCGLPRPSDIPCSLCRKIAQQLGEGKILWQQIFVLGSYQNRLRESVLAGKRPAGEGLVEALSDLLIEQHPSIRDLKLDAVVPVPMHWRKRWERGTNSANTMARKIASRLGVPYRCDIKQKILARPQKSVSAKMRPANASAKFSGVGRQLAGKRVLVVDDVATTGATLSAITRCLLEINASVVYAAVLARTDETISSEGDR
jgi:ComF family protein